MRSRERRKVERRRRKRMWIATVMRCVVLRREVLRTARDLAAFWAMLGR